VSFATITDDDFQNNATLCKKFSIFFSHSLILSLQGNNSLGMLLYERRDNFLRYMLLKVKDVEDTHVFQQ
jgi:hypothetical protein